MGYVTTTKLHVTHDQNTVMKRVAAIASVLLLPSLVIALDSQNLTGLPEYHFDRRYPCPWALLLVATFAQVVYLRRKKWL